MAKATRQKKVTTNQALELLLGRKAAKRLRQVAIELAKKDAQNTTGKKAKKKR
jgi:hypothetical protein